jgi:hypothetical protein
MRSIADTVFGNRSGLLCPYTGGHEQSRPATQAHLLVSLSSKHEKFIMPMRYEAAGYSAMHYADAIERGPASVTEHPAEMTDTAAIISDQYRQPITVQRHRDGGVVIRCPRSVLLLSEADLDRLFSFAHGLGVLRRYPVMAPKSPHGYEIISP